jgi:hypothetical protein
VTSLGETEPAARQASGAGRWHLVHVYNDAEKRLVCHAVETVDQELSQQLQEAKTIITQYFASQKLIRAVFENRNELLESFVTMAASYLNRSENPQTILEDAGFNISRRFANTCTMFRSFLDHYDGYFNRAFGDTSVQFRDWKEVLANEYDTFLSYRVVYVMRNYIQHYDMPPVSVSITEKAEVDGCTTRMDLELAPLMRDKFVRKKLSDILDRHLEKIPLMRLLDEWSESFKRIVAFADGIRVYDALEAAQLIVAQRSRLQLDVKGGLALTWRETNGSRPTRLELPLNWLPEDQANLIIEKAADSVPRRGLHS